MRTLEKFVYWLSSYATGADVDAVCALDGPVHSEEGAEPCVIAQTNGDLISVIDVRGARKFIGKHDYGLMTANIAKSLEKLFRAGSGSQHSFSIGFRSDPDHAEAAIARIMAPQMSTAQALDIRNVRMLIDRRAKLASVCTDESVYLVVRTNARDLQPHERKSQAQERQRLSTQSRNAAGKAGLDFRLAQGVGVPMGALLPKHQAAVGSLVDDLSRDLKSHGAQLLVKVLGCHEAVAAIRKHLDASMLASSWRPRLMGDRAAAAGSAANPVGHDASHLLPRRLSRQMLTGPVTDHFSGRELACHAGRWYASVVLEIVPESGSEPFDNLASRIGRNFPWRASFEVQPNGNNARQLERLLSSILGAVGDYNQAIRKAFNHLRELSSEGVYVGTLRLVVTTWADTREKASVNLSTLSSSIESWGAAGCTNQTGEPGRAMLASASGFCTVSPAPFLPVPIPDIANMLPIGRPASLWNRGQIVFTTNEGRPYPVEFGSSLQNYWATIGFAPTGSGKSFTLNVLNSGLLLAPGAKEVPPITLVDVGKSGALVMDWFRAVLPENLREQVLAITIRNTQDYCVNPFDTQHGFDAALPSDIDFLTAVMGTISPGCGCEAEKFFERVARVAFEKFSRSSPDSKLWQSAFDAKVANKLEVMGFAVTPGTRVWSVVDALFDAGHLEESQSAQRYAMPTMADIPKIAADSRVANVYGGALHNGERIIDIFTRNVVASLDSYVLLSSYTRFNIGAARAVAIDLQDVVGSMSSEEGRRRSGLMFLLARRIGARNYFLKWDEIEKLCPARYAHYQERRVAKLWETIKFLQYDEAHYFSNVEAVTHLVQSDLRTGRKFNLVTAMFSQLMEDFSPALIENTYIFFIMGLGDSSPAAVRERFALSDDEMSAISRYCIRPGTMFARFKTRAGTLSQILHLPASAYEQWAFTTQGKDQTLRAALARRMGYARVLDVMADLFPNGSAEAYLRRLLAERADAREDDEALADFAAQRIVEQLDASSRKLSTRPAE
ncbi:MAG: hypothetical protein V4731_03980 [Pseudomonadota bacterium]